MRDEDDNLVLNNGEPIELAYNYLFYLEPGGYNIVVTKPGYAPACQTVSAQQDKTYTLNFDLQGIDTASVDVEIKGNAEPLDEDDETPFIELSFQQKGLCGDDWVETYYEKIAPSDGGYNTDNGNFSFGYQIPVLGLGDYRVVASVPGLDGMDPQLQQIIEDPLFAVEDGSNSFDDRFW